MRNLTSDSEATFFNLFRPTVRPTFVVLTMVGTLYAMGGCILDCFDTESNLIVGGTLVDEEIGAPLSGVSMEVRAEGEDGIIGTPDLIETFDEGGFEAWIVSGHKRRCISVPEYFATLGAFAAPAGFFDPPAVTSVTLTVLLISA